MSVDAMRTIKKDEPVDGSVGQLVSYILEGKGVAELFGMDEESIDILEAQAYRFYQNQRYEQALIAAHGIVALDKNRPVSYLILGDIALSEYRFQEAVEHLCRAHQLAPEEIAIQARYGEALLKSGNVEEALLYLEAAAEALMDDKSETAQRVSAFLGYLRR